MRKNLGFVAIGLGAFLLLVGVMAVVWAPGKAKKTPLDTDSVTTLVGTGGSLDPATGTIDIGPLQSTSMTKADAKASDDDVIVWVNVSCLVKAEEETPGCVDGEDPRLITATVEAFATERYDATAVSNEGYLPEDTEEPQREGLVNKWPFDAEKKTYQYWDGVLGTTVDAVYDRTENVQETETYVYKVSINDEPATVVAGLEGTYTNNLEIFVEPKTGAIMNQTVDQQRFLEDGTQVLEVSLAYSDESLDSTATLVDDNIGLLNLLTTTVPLLGFIGGFLLLALGLFLSLGGRTPAPAGGSRSSGVSLKK